MTLTKFPLLGGVYKDDTPSEAEGYAIDCSGMRFHRGKWQVRGGWSLATGTGLAGIVRGSHAWADLAGIKLAAFGAADWLKVFYGGSVNDITPLKGKGTLVDPFATVSGSATVTVTHAAHGFKSDDTITYSLGDAVGGLTLNDTYTITVTGFDTYTITASGNASSSATGGGDVEYEAPLDEGLVDALGFGYGAGNYGEGIYGGINEAETRPRTWFLDNWGQNLVAVPLNGALYEYQPQPQYPELVTNGEFTSSASWTAGTGWSIGSGVATATAGSASDLSQDLTGIISGGVAYAITFTVTRSAGGFQFRVHSEASASDITFGETIEKSGTYTRRFIAPANPTLIKFAKDATFAGTIDNVSIKVLDVAYRNMDAPQYSRAMFVDPHRFVILLGTVQFNGDFNSMCVRWCDQENLRTWTPDSDNQAGEYVLARGSEIRGGVATRGHNLIWTDDALYTMRYVASSDVFSFDLVGTGCGLIAPMAFAEINGVVFWWGSDGNFYMYQGGAPQVLSSTIRRDVNDNLTQAQRLKIAAGVNSRFGEVLFFYPDGRDDDGQECSRAAIFNWDENCWYPDQSARTDWIGQGVFPNPISFSPDGEMFFQESGYSANGNAMSWFIETGALDMGEGDTLYNLMRMIPDFEDQQGSVSDAISIRNWPNDSWTLKTTVTFATSDKKKDMRVTGRQMKHRFSGSSSPAFARFGAVKADIQPSGAKR